MNDCSLPIDDQAGLESLARDFLQTEGSDLLARWNCQKKFWDARRAARLDPYFRVSLEQPGPECQIVTRDQARISGVNFASPDYLSLASHPALREAAVDAITRWVVHSPGSHCGARRHYPAHSS